MALVYTAAPIPVHDDDDELMDDLVNIKSAPSTSLVSTEAATATDLTFAQALGENNDEVWLNNHWKQDGFNWTFFC